MRKWTFLWLFSLLSPLVFAQASLDRALVCRDVVQREPVGILDGKQLPGGVDQLVLFTEVSGAAGEKIHHRWYLNGQLQSDVALPVGANHWRTWSQKHVQPGQWRLEVLSEDGQLLYERDLTLGNVESSSS
ncbi:MAG: DUF2914 domain-containing protein [Pseudomonadota bacterium]|uniref:DUF2914 domain-containing protein n=1 Tax=Gallaecimonas pentaromativorans TaxID=584787 RepID=UPI00067E9694|nr:DUF2914 domain-containing protein [Gallaecimonas pentaromativorans]MED5526213.1 DUF2914 domain-containing protein [Pseudomonadota bacterium]